MDPKDWKSVIGKILRHMQKADANGKLSHQYWDSLPDSVARHTKYDLMPWREVYTSALCPTHITILLVLLSVTSLKLITFVRV